MSFKLQIKVLDPRAAIPARGTPMSAGYDLIACIPERLTLKYGEKSVLIPTGLAMFIDSPDIAGILLPRSGLGHKSGLMLGNTLGLIDGDYQNQWFVSAWNRGNGANPWGHYPDVVINPGDRIAQVIFVPVLHPSFVQTEEFSVTTERGLGGFGSTGVMGEAVIGSMTDAMGFIGIPAPSYRAAGVDTSNNGQH